MNNPFEKAAAGTWEGTADIIQKIARESRYKFTWRPARAAAILAIAGLTEGEGRVDMTSEAFMAWVTEMRVVMRGQGIKKPRPDELVGLPAKHREYMRKRGGVNKMIAVACAHARFGLPMPVAEGDHEAFDAWFRPRFGSVDPLADWLNINRPFLQNRLRGFRVDGDKRTPTPPDAGLIRACDWVWRMGPFSPYSARPAVPMWPGQEALS